MIENTFGKNIIPENDEERVKVLRRYNILHTPSEDSFDNLAQLATKIFNVPISLISLVDTETVFFKANIGMGDTKEVNRGKSLCSLAVLAKDVTVFEDALKEPCLIANPNVAGDFGLRFYAGAPLVTHDGHLIGTLCVVDQQPRIFNEEERLVLQHISTAVMDQIELRLSALTEIDKQHKINRELEDQRKETLVANEKLAASNEELLATNDELSQSQRELEFNEAKFRLIADNISQLAFMANKDGEIFWFNRRWFDYTNADNQTLLDDGWEQLIHPDHASRVIKKMRTHFETGEGFDDTLPLKSRDGEYRWFLLRAVSRKDDTGNVVSWFGTYTDVTEQRKLEAMKDDFISVASHELKTPFTGLKASLQMLNSIKEQPFSDIHLTLVEQSYRSMTKMGALIDELLNVSRISEGQLQLQKSNFDIVELLRNCCTHVRVDRKHELIIQSDEEVIVYADENRVDQVLVNFVNNAAKYAPDSRNIYLIVERQNLEVKISVKDGGRGIASDQLAHLFDRYYRADHSSNTYSGLGLGLYISAEIIKRHGGKIGVESELGKGSTFWFTIAAGEN